MENVRPAIHKLMVEKFGLQYSDIHDDAAFITDYHIDSLDLFEFIIEVEKIFAVTIPEEEMDKITTPAQLISFLSNQAIAAPGKVQSSS